MTTPIDTSNMTSQNYCSKCESFDLVKIHRGLLGRLFKSPNKLHCNSCSEDFLISDLLSNEQREIPLFIGAESPLDFTSPNEKQKKVIENPFGGLIEEKREANLNHFGAVQQSEKSLQAKKSWSWFYYSAALLLVCCATYIFVWLPLSAKHGVDSPIAFIQGVVEGEVLVASAEERKVTTFEILPPEEPLSMQVKNQTGKVIKFDESVAAEVMPNKLVEAVDVPVLITEVEVVGGKGGAKTTVVNYFDKKEEKTKLIKSSKRAHNLETASTTDMGVADKALQEMNSSKAHPKLVTLKQVERSVVKSIKSDLDRMFK